MLQIDLNAQVRNTFGKGAARSLRSEGFTPAVLYGPKADPIALQVDTGSFTKAILGFQRQNAVINLDIKDGKKKLKRHVMIKELQADPVRDTLVHADFCEVSLKEPIVLDVLLKFTGIAQGVDLGGELHIIEHTVSLEGKVLDIPDFLELDVTELHLGDKLTCGDLNIPENVTLREEPEKVCVSVQTATVLPEEEVEEEETAEPVAEEGSAQESADEPATE